MKKCVLFVTLLACTGCQWLVPGTIKREAAFVTLNVDVALAEIRAMPPGPEREKAIRTLQRIQPHIVNIDNYMQGRKSSSTVTQTTAVPDLTPPELK